MFNKVRLTIRKTIDDVATILTRSQASLNKVGRCTTSQMAINPALSHPCFRILGLNSSILFYKK